MKIRTAYFTVGSIMPAAWPLLAILFFAGSFQAHALKISGRFHYPADSTLIFSFYKDGLANEMDQPNEVRTKVSEEGFFTVQLELPEPTTLNLMNGDKWVFYNIYFDNSDSLYFQFYQDSISVAGKGEAHVAWSFEDEKLQAQAQQTLPKTSLREYANHLSLYRESRLNLLDEMISEHPEEQYQYEDLKETIDYDFAVQLVQYAWRDKDKGAVLFKDAQATQLLSEIILDYEPALNNRYYQRFLRELPYAIFTVMPDTKDPAQPKKSKYNLATQFYLRDSISQSIFSGASYDFALLKLLHEQITLAENYKGSATEATNIATIDSLIQNNLPRLANENYKQAIVAKWQEFNKPTPAPELVAYNAKGKPIKLSDYRGKIVYLNFWATNCAPCVAEIPQLKVLQEAYKGKDLVILMVSLDEQASVWKKFLKEKKLKGLQAHAAGNFLSDPARNFSVNSLPSIFLIDREGNIISRNAPRPGNSALIEMLDKALAK